MPRQPLDANAKSPARATEADPIREVPDEQRRLGDYRLVTELSRGGMGIVYLALKGAELVLLKELRPELVDNASLVQMFDEEARLASLLSHPNIVQTIDVGTDGRRRFIAMEYLEGQTLQRLVEGAVAQSKRMPLPMHLRILLEILSALESAHGTTDGESGLGVVHGDVSPHKVLVTYDGQVKIIDFGISETFGAMAETPASRAAEKVRYTAPEQAAGAIVDGRADLFAVGVMLWEAIADRRPWDDQPDDVVRRRLKSGSVPRVRDAWPYVDPHLAAIVDRAMSAHPDQRYPTAIEMRRDLERHVGASQIRLPGAESLGNFVCGLFAEERETRRSQVHAMLRSPPVESPPVPARSVSVPAKPAPSPSPPPDRARPAAVAIGPARAMAFPPPRHAAGRRQAMLPVAISACLGAFLALAAVSATRLHAGDVGPPPAPPAIVVATAVRPPSPAVSIDEVPPESNSSVPVPPPTATHRLGRKAAAPAAPVAHEVISATPAADCDPPFTVDPQTGKKQWRIDCL